MLLGYKLFFIVCNSLAWAAKMEGVIFEGDNVNAVKTFNMHSIRILEDYSGS